jgi:hypothetical protein
MSDVIGPTTDYVVKLQWNTAQSTLKWASQFMNLLR